MTPQGGLPILEDLSSLTERAPASRGAHELRRKGGEFPKSGRCADGDPGTETEGT